MASVFMAMRSHGCTQRTQAIVWWGDQYPSVHCFGVRQSTKAKGHRIAVLLLHQGGAHRDTGEFEPSLSMGWSLQNFHQILRTVRRFGSLLLIFGGQLSSSLVAYRSHCMPQSSFARSTRCATDACQETRANPEEVERLTSCEREYLFNIQRIGVAPQIQLLAVNRQRGHAISELIALNAVMPPHMVNR